MERFRLQPAAFALLLCLLASVGCRNLRLPAIDPSGQSVFLPRPNYTSLAADGPLSRLCHHGRRSEVAAAPGPYQPALPKGPGLCSKFHADSDAAFTTPAEPPLCNADGTAPDGGPCFPVGSPSESSLQATLPQVPVGSGVLPPGPWGPPAPTEPPVGKLTALGPRVVLTRKQYVAPVGAEVVIVGGVQAESGVSRPGEPVRWSLSNNSAGTIVDGAVVATGGKKSLFNVFQSHREAPSKDVYGSTVPSVTSARCYTMPRDPSTAADDVQVDRGQTWVSLTSGGEGVSYITLAAPMLPSGRQATATVHWVDVDVQIPRPVLSGLSGPASLVSRVVRRSDGTPLAGWMVRYRVLAEGVDAQLAGGGEKVIDVTTDVDGRAGVNVTPVTPQAGTTRVQLEFFQPTQPGQSARLVSQGLAYVTWSAAEPAVTAPPPTAAVDPNLSTPPPASQPPSVPPLSGGNATPPPMSNPPGGGGAESPASAPSLTINVAIPPEPVTVGAAVPFRVTVKNIGESTARDVRILSQPLTGANYLGSAPEPQVNERGSLVWSLGDLEPNIERSIELRYRFDQRGAFAAEFATDARNAAPKRNRGQVTVQPEPISIRILDPQPFNARVNDVVTFEILITNNTEQLIRANLNDDYDQGLEPEVKAGAARPTGSITVPDVTIPAGQTERVELAFRALRAGTLSHRAYLQGYRARAEGIVRVMDAGAASPAGGGAAASGGERLQVSIVSGPETMQAGDTAEFQLRIENVSRETVQGLRIQYRASEDLYVAEASGNPGSSEGGLLLSWPVVESPLPPDYELLLVLRLKANESPSVTNARNIIQISTDRGIEYRGEVPVKIVENR